MKSLKIFIYEWKHFIRNPFKSIALLLFIIASIYGLHNGAELYEKQNSEIARVSEKIDEQKKSLLAHYENNEKGPKSKPWIDLTSPYWAIYSSPNYHFKKPSPAIVYNIGQTEQYGFYKAINTSSTPYDADMTKEISNPERIQSGSLDFAFSILFLLPLLLLILLYNIKGQEAEQGFLPLVFVQTASKNWWIFSRVAFYTGLLLFTLFGLMLYGAFLTNVFEEISLFWSIFLWVGLYLLFWVVLFYIILKYGKNTISNTLQMIGIWLLVTFIIPATIQQWISIEKPTNLMIDIIDAKREKTGEILAQSDAAIYEQLFELYPSLKQTKTATDSVRFKKIKRSSIRPLINETLKNAIADIEKDNQAKNKLISKSYLFNPLTYFQNKLNLLSKTHFDNYQTYRDEIQELVDIRVKVMIFDLWKDIKVDKNKFLEYNSIFSK